MDSATATDCADWRGTGIVSGVTTNSTILARSGATSLTAALRQILACGPDEVHAQILSEADEQAFLQATALAALDPRIRVKIPFVTSQGRSRAALIRRVREAGVRVNVTVCTSRAELYAALSLAPEYLSILWCRTRDAGEEPAAVVRAIATRRSLTGSATKLVIGSIREPADVTAALDSPCDIVTVPPAVLDKWLVSPRSVEMARQFAMDAAGLDA
ncbi:transaldolase family protein [Streptomyces sp. NRRL S-340]|uniref:transaldolase family protein n=1 Tax=Streptomyces sp. NRRL S-340 TaxID=1463901 RepID=UPI0005651095|nr:transaldolase family protein [Streptomyces sp. NRRL S-340]